MKKGSSENQNYKTGLSYELGVNQMRDYRQAYQYYLKASLEGDFVSLKKIKYAKTRKLPLLLNLLGFVLLFILASALNSYYLPFFLSGISFTLTSLYLLKKYWIKTSFAYWFNLFIIYFCLLIMIPISAAIPHLYGVTTMPIFILMAFSLFAASAGVIVFLSERKIANFSIILSGLLVLVSAIYIYTIQTPDQAFYYQETTNGVVITGIRDRYAEEIIIPDTINNLKVIAIGEYAFLNHPASKVELSANLEEIRAYGFSNMPNLTEISIPNGVVLQEGAFAQNLYLTKVELPEDLTVLPRRAFIYNVRLTDITLPDSIEEIGIEAFSYCVSLPSINLPEGLTSILSAAFTYTNAIEKIVIPNSVTTIGASAFGRMSNLREITLSTGVSRIPDYFVQDAISLTSFDFNPEVTEIGAYAFSGTSLTQIELHDDIVVINDGAFSKITTITSVELPNQITQVARELFADCINLTEVIIPPSVKTIGARAFMNNQSLQTIVLPLDLEVIDAFAFEGASNLKNITLPQGLTRLGDGAFKNASSLERIVIPSLIQTINSEVFRGTTNLSEVLIEGEITSVGQYAFYQATQLTSIQLGTSTRQIGAYAFFGATALNEVILEEGLEMILPNAFGNCSSLVNITLPTSLVRLDRAVFSNCVLLSEVSLHQNLNFVGQYAFNNCVSLTIYVHQDIPTQAFEDNWNNSNREVIYFS